MCFFLFVFCTDCIRVIIRIVVLLFAFATNRFKFIDLTNLPRFFPRWLLHHSQTHTHTCWNRSTFGIRCTSPLHKQEFWYRCLVRFFLYSFVNFISFDFFTFFFFFIHCALFCFKMQALLILWSALFILCVSMYVFNIFRSCRFMFALIYLDCTCFVLEWLENNK